MSTARLILVSSTDGLGVPPLASAARARPRRAFGNPGMLARAGCAVKLIIHLNSYVSLMNINLRQLQAFVGAYRLGSLTRAAEQMFITQPAASVLLRQLEESIGVRLFDRTTRSLRPTAARTRRSHVRSAFCGN